MVGRDLHRDRSSQRQDTLPGTLNSGHHCLTYGQTDRNVENGGELGGERAPLGEERIGIEVRRVGGHRQANVDLVWLRPNANTHPEKVGVTRTAFPQAPSAVARAFEAVKWT